MNRAVTHAKDMQHRIFTWDMHPFGVDMTHRLLGGVSVHHQNIASDHCSRVTFNPRIVIWEWSTSNQWSQKGRRADRIVSQQQLSVEASLEHYSASHGTVYLGNDQKLHHGDCRRRSSDNQNQRVCG